ncbi:MAG: LptF/LptG family permease, partial [Planctomycetes bacterium]|nr:LptF/LptG family permease [Planctomycetota bacterium]
MRILTRTCIAETLRLFVFYALAFSLLVSIAVSAPLLHKGAPVSAVLSFIPLQLIYTCPYLIPLALCTAILNVFGRMDDDGELIALRAVGISAWHVVRGLIPFILVIAGSMSLLQLFILPQVALHIREGKSSLIRQGIATKINRGDPIWENKKNGRMILAQEGDGVHLQHIIAYTYDDGRQNFIYAPQGHWAFDQDLHLSCSDLRYFDLQLKDSSSPSVITANIPRSNQIIPTESLSQRHRSKPDVKSLGELENSISELEDQVSIARAEFQPGAHSWDLNRYSELLRAHQLAWHLRMQAPFAIFSYFILACALALWLRISNRLIASILGIGIIMINLLPGIIAVKSAGQYIGFSPGYLV